MNIRFVCPFWGQENNLLAFADQVLKAGYHGAEINVPAGEKGLALVKSIKANQLTFTAQQWLPPASENFSGYLLRFKNNCLRLAELQPEFINSHTGKDYFSFEENCRIIEAAFEITDQTGVRIVHETHRGRFTFHAAGLQPYLLKYPELQITADYSHWCVVSESLLEDQQQTITNTLPHVKYIHARVGFDQGPQVNDARAPEWETALNQHIKWWDDIIDHSQKAESPTLFICPEFGPEPYLMVTPFTQKPFSNQWELNLWMKDLLSNRYTKP